MKELNPALNPMTQNADECLQIKIIISPEIIQPVIRSPTRVDSNYNHLIVIVIDNNIITLLT